MKRAGKKNKVGKKIHNFDQLQAMVNNMKIEMSTGISSLEERVKLVNRNITTFSKALGALIDLIGDATNIPGKVIADRFIYYNQERHMLDSNGEVKGNIKITGYGLKEPKEEK